jgi:hypothetical protein
MPRLIALIVACGCVGLVGCFLPRGESLWDVREDLQIYWILACFVAAIVIGGVAYWRGPVKRWHGLVALEAFALVVLKFRLDFVDLITDGDSGARLIAGATIVGLLTSGVVTWVARPPQA